MAKEAVDSVDVERCLRLCLQNDGYALNPVRGNGENGVDVLATRNNENWHIEVIGYKKAGWSRAKDFFESFFRVTSRLNDGATHCVIALAKQAEEGLPARAGNHRVAWKRIANAFPELEIWLVDVENRNYRRTAWGDWLS